MNPVALQAIEEAALLRHGSRDLQDRLASPLSEAELEALPTDRYLSAMSRRIFRAGLKHELVDRKWPAFEEVFLGFDPAKVAALYDEDLEAMLEDKRLIRHMGKIKAVRHNAAAMQTVAEEKGSFGRYIATWPVTDIVGLWADLGKRMQQMGGISAPYFLRMVGKDTFILTGSVVRGLGYWKAFEGTPKTKADLQAVQKVFNRWHEESGRPLCQLSQILAMSSD